MICKLCCENKDLRRSHIIPEFLYRNLGIYDDKNRFKVISSNPKKRVKYEQKGFREYLLCDNCEEKIQKWEDYVARFWFQKSNQPINHKIGSLESQRKGFSRLICFV